jgi:signal transduction histidine kinase
MPHPGRFTRERLRQRVLFRDHWRDDRWFGNWEERVLASQRRATRGSRAARLWVPVILSLFLQVPSSFFHFIPGTGMVRSALWGTPGMGLAVAIAVAGPLALIAARRLPGPVVAFVTVVASVDLLLYAADDHPPYFALGFAIVSAVVRGARVWAWISVAAGGAATLTIALLAGTYLPPLRITAVTLGVLLVMGIGEGIRTRRQTMVELSRRVAQRKQNEVQAERVRIARELHDVLAHSLSQINVQAGVGLHLMDSQPGKAKEALASIKESSKTALDEVRAVLGILRAEGGADPSAPLVPEPDLSRLAGLVASISSEGIDVQLDNRIAEQPPAAAQLALYRIAQESLTNVLRHSRATHVTVLADRQGDDYVITITDDGIGAASQHDASRQDSGGRGLLGMNERAELLGGTLEAAPLPDGGFRVSARIPAPAKDTE